MISPKKYASWMNVELEPKDILIVSEGGSLRGFFSWQGWSTKIAQVPEKQKFALGQRLYALKLKIDIVEPDYLFNYLRSPQGLFEILSRGTGTTALGIRLTDLVKIPIPLPNIHTQRKTVKIFPVLERFHDINQSSLDTCNKLIFALLRSWFIDFDPVKAKAEGKLPYGMNKETAALFPDSFEDSELGPIPLGWKLGTLSDIANFQNGYAFKSSDWCDEGIPVIQIGSVKPGFVDINSCAYVAEDCVQGLDKFRLNVGDIVVGMTGYVGETGLVLNSNLTPYLNQRVGRFIPLEKMYHEFIYANVRNPSFKFHAETFATGSAQANVSGSNLMAYTIVIPPPELMKCFSNLANPMIQQILHSFSTSDIFGNLRDSISPSLMSGELSVS
jgi:type I restriction enzyme, S subunit